MIISYLIYIYFHYYFFYFFVILLCYYLSVNEYVIFFSIPSVFRFNDRVLSVYAIKENSLLLFFSSFFSLNKYFLLFFLTYSISGAGKKGREIKENLKEHQGDNNVSMFIMYSYNNYIS